MLAEALGEFHSVVILVENAGETTAPVGEEIAYWFYGWLSGRYRGLESIINWTAHGARAITVSPLLAAHQGRVVATIEPGRRYAIRLTFLERLSYLYFRESIWRHREAVIPLGQHRLRPIDLTEDPRVHPLAGRATAEELRQWGFANAGRPLRLHFLTPTAFKQTYRPTPDDKPIDIDVPLPDPARIIASLAGRWERYAPLAAGFPAEQIEQLRQTTALRQLEIRTVLGRPKRPVHGFIGWAELVSRSRDPDIAAALATLCRFATFSGIGAKTALGLGAVHLVADPAADTPRPRPETDA